MVHRAGSAPRRGRRGTLRGVPARPASLVAAGGTRPHITGTDANAPAADGGELAHTGASGTRTLGLVAGALLLAGAGLGVVVRRRPTRGA